MSACTQVYCWEEALQSEGGGGGGGRRGKGKEKQRGGRQKGIKILHLVFHAVCAKLLTFPRLPRNDVVEVTAIRLNTNTEHEDKMWEREKERERETDLLDEERSAESEARGVRSVSLDVSEQHGDDGWLHILT